MSEKFQNKYRIESARLQTWDYGWNGAYFVTMCTQNRACFFGDIVDGKMRLSETGKIAHKFWIEIPNHFPFVKLGEFVVMPNHVHGIVVIDKLKNHEETPNLGVSTHNLENHEETTTKLENHEEMPNLGVSTHNLENHEETTTKLENHEEMPNLGVSTAKNGGKNEKWKPGTLGVIINQYKRICTIHSRKINSKFGWQTRFHDSIIRNDLAFYRISNYIIQNPSKWGSVAIIKQEKQDS